MKNYTSQFYGLLIAISTMSFFGSCSTNTVKTDKDKITELVMEYAKNNVPDYESFEIIEMSEWDSTYTEISKENMIHNHAQAYKEVISQIEASQNEIQRINNYLMEVDSHIEQANLNLEKIIYHASDIVGYSSRGSKIKWIDTMEGMRTFERANNEIEKLKGYKSDAQAMKQKEENHLRELIGQEQTIKDKVKIFCSNWEKQYIGKSIQMKCRLKNNEGNMNIEVYDVLCNDSLSNIISIADTTQRHTFDNMKDFIMYCYK